MYVVKNHSLKYRIRRHVAAVIGASLAAVLLCAVSLAVLPIPTTAPAPCEEDESCWDCETMGNGVCGPATVVTVDGVSVLVDARGNILGEISEP